MINNNYYFETTSFTFESDLLEVIGEVCGEIWGINSYRHAEVFEDKNCGTDCFVVGIPTDVTMNFDQKRRMKKLSTVIEFPLGKVRLGIRYGNSRHTFKEPVLVIGIESCLGIGKNNCIDIINSVKDKLEEILTIGQDMYMEHTV